MTENEMQTKLGSVGYLLRVDEGKLASIGSV